MSIVNKGSPRRSVFQWMTDHPFEIFLLLYGAWVFLPFLAPLLMHIGWTGAGKIIYIIYSFFCHQLPERSFFLFGRKLMYSIPEIQSVWANTNNPLILRKFTGNAIMGWKIAWSDRMVSFYTSIWFFAAIWYPIRHRLKPLPWWGFLLLVLPLIVDGITHLISDFSGIGKGFRDTNIWLATLTNSAFPRTFYSGDAIGSFNSSMRLITGLIAGLGIVWLIFPYVFQSQNHAQQPDKISYVKVIEQIKEQNSRPSG